MKLRLFPILTLMEHDITTATQVSHNFVVVMVSRYSLPPPMMQVREVCVKLLPAYPSLAFVTAILHTLTELSIATLIHIPNQVSPRCSGASTLGL